MIAARVGDWVIPTTRWRDSVKFRTGGDALLRQV